MFSFRARGIVKKFNFFQNKARRGLVEVLQYPHPKLRLKSEDVNVEVELESAKQIAAALLEALYAGKGAGIAAPQIGINKNILVFNAGSMDVPMDFSKEFVMINPEIERSSCYQVDVEEGCLSFPEIVGSVGRYDWIEVNYTNLSGERQEGIRLEEFDAILFQHEFDHLNGVLFVDKFVYVEDDEDNKPKLDRLVKDFGDSAAP